MNKTLLTIKHARFSTPQKHSPVGSTQILPHDSIEPQNTGSNHAGSILRSVRQQATGGEIGSRVLDYEVHGMVGHF